MKPRFLLQWPSAHLHVLVLFLIFLLTIFHRFSIGFMSGEFVGHLTNFWCFWQCGQVPNPAGK